MTPGRLDMEIPRNGSDARLLKLYTRDEDGAEAPCDLTGCTVSAVARDIFGGDEIATAAVNIDTPAEGLVSIEWRGSQFDGFGNLFATASAAWDLKVVDPDGLPTVPVRGILYISPEATA